MPPAVLAGALQLALQLGMPNQELLQQLLSSPSGAELYQAFKATLHGWLLFNGAQLVPHLLKVIAERATQQQQQQEEALAGVEGSSGTGGAVGSSGRGDQRSMGPQPGLVSELLLLGVCQGLVHSQAAAGKQDMRTRGWVMALLEGEGVAHCRLFVVCRRLMWAF
jgi:hypothetical protein